MTRTHHEWTCADLRALRTGYDAGRTYADLAHEFGTTIRAIQSQVHLRCFPCRRKPDPVGPAHPEPESAALLPTLLAQGLNYNDPKAAVRAAEKRRTKESK